MKEKQKTDLPVERMGHAADQETIKATLYVTWVGFWINTVLCILKVTIGFMANSRAIVADGVHSLSDLITDIAVLVGVRFWMAPADEDHPYGHLRLESLVALSIGILLAVAGAGVVIDAVSQIGQNKAEKVGSFLALVVLFGSFVVKEWLFRWTLKTGRAIKSSAVEANAWDHRSDALSSIPVFFAVGIAHWMPQYADIDFWAALLVAGFIFYSAYGICKPAVNVLLDRGADAETNANIQAFAASIPGILGVKRLRTRYMGQSLLVDLHAEVRSDLTVHEGNKFAHALQDALCSEEAAAACGVTIISVLVHIDPYEDGSDAS